MLLGLGEHKKLRGWGVGTVNCLSGKQIQTIDEQIMAEPANPTIP